MEGGSLEKREVVGLTLPEYTKRLRLKNMPNLILTNLYKALPEHLETLHLRNTIVTPEDLGLIADRVCSFNAGKRLRYLGLELLDCFKETATDQTLFHLNRIIQTHHATLEVINLSRNTINTKLMSSIAHTLSRFGCPNLKLIILCHMKNLLFNSIESLGGFVPLGLQLTIMFTLGHYNPKSKDVVEFKAIAGN